MVALESYRFRTHAEFAGTMPAQHEDVMAQGGGPTDREIDAKIEAAEARTDTKIARLDGKIDLSLQKLDQIAVTMKDALGDMKMSIAEVQGQARSNLHVMVSVVVAGMLAIFFGLFAVLQWSDARMFGAIQFRDSLKPPSIGAEPTPAKPVAEPPKPPLDTPTK